MLEGLFMHAPSMPRSEQGRSRQRVSSVQVPAPAVKTEIAPVSKSISSLAVWHTNTRIEQDRSFLSLKLSQCQRAHWTRSRQQQSPEHSAAPVNSVKTKGTEIDAAVTPCPQPTILRETAAR
jgi:hypothetical protein